MPIRFLTYEQIDLEKWDQCVLQSHAGLIYSSSIFLNHMAANWSALVLDDYAAVMALPWKRKWGLSYIYPPAFTQQLGICAAEIVAEQMVNDFMNAIPAKFKFIEANLNNGNAALGQFQLRKNYVLLLDKDFSVLQKNFSRSANRNIVKAKEQQIVVAENADPLQVLQMHRERFKDGIGSNAEDYQRLQSLIKKLQTAGSIYCITARKVEGAVIAGSIFTLYKDRVTFLINGNTPESLANGATHLLMHHCIQYFSGRSLFLDFEGSDNPAFARFYEQYGATPEHYPFIRRNRLPWPIKLLKPADDANHF
ncbi:MAG: GNAT family N-acetyltransferase [Chitinophagaceae bacterium]|nr:MAG: GNAT family N-acetyltransferase [Chitinophagaceae bacterium]